MVRRAHQETRADSVLVMAESVTEARETGARFSSLGGICASDTFAGSLLLLLATAITLGPVFGSGPPAAAFVCWVIGTTYWLGAKLSKLRYFPPAIGVLAVTAFVFATVRLSSLGFVKLLLNRPALFWNIDWRYHATHSQTISRFGNLSDSLDYAGVPTIYHAGPAWFSGGLERATGLNPDVTLFVIFPIIVVPATGYWLYRTFRTFEFSSATALLIVSALVNFVKLPRFIFEPALRNAGSFMISPSMMLNSLLGLIFLFAGLSLVLSPFSSLRSIGLGSLLVGLSSCAKPQYALLGAALVPVLLIVRMMRDGGGWRRASAFVGLACLVPVVMVVAAPRVAGTGTSVSIGFPLWEYFSTELLFFVIVLALTAILGLIIRDDVARAAGKSALILSAAALCLGVVITATRYTGDVLGRTNSAEIGYSAGSVWHTNMNGAFAPFAILATGIIFGVLVRAARVRELLVGKGMVVATLMVSAPVTVLPIVSPTGTSGHEWVEDRALYRLMESQPVEDGLWLSNDLADPAQEFTRRLNALHLTSSFPAQFYVSNFRYGHYRQADAVIRLRSTRRFFLTEWSDWHTAFLVANEIRFVLVHQRCDVAWKTPSGIPYSESSDGPWTLLKFDVESPMISGSPDYDSELFSFAETSTRCL